MDAIIYIEDHCMLVNINTLTTVDVDIFAQYIFSRISHRALDARKFDVSENYNHNSTNRNKQYSEHYFSHM